MLRSLGYCKIKTYAKTINEHKGKFNLFLIKLWTSILFHVLNYSEIQTMQ